MSTVHIKDTIPNNDPAALAAGVAELLERIRAIPISNIEAIVVTIKLFEGDDDVVVGACGEVAVQLSLLIGTFEKLHEMYGEMLADR